METHNLLPSLLNQVQWHCSKGFIIAKWFTKLTPIQLWHKIQTTFADGQDISMWEVVSSSLSHKTHGESTTWTDLLNRFCFVVILSYSALQAKHCDEGGINRPHMTLNMSLKAYVVELRILYVDLIEYLQFCGSPHSHLSFQLDFKVWSSKIDMNSSTCSFSHSNHSLIHLNSKLQMLLFHLQKQHRELSMVRELLNNLGNLTFNWQLSTQTSSHSLIFSPKPTGYSILESK